MDFEEPSNNPPPVSSGSCGSMKEITQVISDLKKENFDLKLRAFYYEERLQEQCDASVQDMEKINIDLKLEVETLKEEIKKLQRAAAKAPEKDPLGMEELSEHSSLRIAQLEKDLELSRAEMESLTNLLEQARLCILELENGQRDPPAETEPSSQGMSEDRNLDLLNMQEERERLIEQLQESVNSQDAIINQLRSSHAGKGKSDQPNTDSNYQPLTLVDLQGPEQDYSREKWIYDKQLREVQELLERATEEMVKKDTLLADAELKVKSLEITSQKVNTKLQEKEQCLLTLGKELSDEKIKYESKVRELQDALEESSEDVSNKDFLLSEIEIKMKEQESTINALTCMLQEKVQSIPTDACADNPSDCQQESVLEQEIKDLKEALKKAKEELRFVVEEKNKEIDQLQTCLHHIKVRPPTKDGLLLNAQESINRYSKDGKEPLLVTAENSKDLGEHMTSVHKIQTHLFSSPYNSLVSNLQEAVRAVVKDMDQNILSVEKVFTQLAQAKKVLREHLSRAIQQKDLMISQLQQQLHQIPAHLRVTSRQLYVKSNNSCEEIDRLKQCLKETQAILIQTTVITERELIISNIRLLESMLKEMEDIVFKVAVQELHEHQCAGEMMQARDEDHTKKVKALESKHKETQGVLAQTTVKLFQDDKPADHGLQAEGEASNIELDVLEQVEHRLSDTEDTTEDEEGPLTYHKSTVQKVSASEVRWLDRNLTSLRLSNESLMKRLKASDGLNKILCSQLHLCRNIMAQWDGDLSSCVIPSLVTVDKETEGKRCSATLTHNQGSECGITSQEIALSSQVLSEIKQIKEQFTPKSMQEASTQTPKETPAKQFGLLERPQSVINISCVEYGEDKSPGRNPLDTKNRDGMEKNSGIQQSGSDTIVHESAPSSVNSALPSDTCLQDPYQENLKLNKEVETLKMEQSRHKRILSEALQQLRRVNKRKLERLCD